ncbi:DUF1428 domain-containing protein [Frigidibacter oleivorans]|uniref:DUF1428 domain-containing protein n=1 Tax=Frigidibacter oleivorans TaxID=2487129 RepID=UPI000F8D381D|nr:DUF1428 domain-containing protein [Frigidibacter oleivorans]
MAFIDGFLAAVSNDRKDEYIAAAQQSWALFKDYGALAQRECWGADVPQGKVTSFPMAVKLQEGETVVFSWIEWPDRATRDACYATMETDPRWKDMQMPFDGQRMIYGGFEPIFEG